jgi:hypothetical protein
MVDGPESSADALPDTCTRQEAMDLFWQLAQRLARPITEWRRVHRLMAERWGRAPRLPKW